MTTLAFNENWTVRPKKSIFAQIGGGGEPAIPVTLPHDALISQPRVADGQGKSAYFPAAASFEYAKDLDVPEDYRNKKITLEIQGAYRDAVVYVNGNYAGQRPYGYSSFTVPLNDFLNYGDTNSIRVDVRAFDDSRWYTGVGITRDVLLHVTDLTHLDSVHVTTPTIDDDLAVVELDIQSSNDGLQSTTVSIDSNLTDADGNSVAHESSLVTLRSRGSATSRHRIYLENPHRWNVDDPYLYTARVTVRYGDDVIDETSTTVGVRDLRLDPHNGLRINGQSIKLRGACIHHDNGLLGAATIGRAEERRVELLKEAGFNAIRSAHNPLSTAMLDACDRLGMLVMDETFDMWTEGKSSFDYSLSFPEWWERDVEAMVEKDFNHPSVIFYSIGNEIPETGQGLGSEMGRRLAEKVRQLDSTRFVTNGINGFVSALTDVMAMMPARDGGAEGVNDAMASFGDMMNRISASPLVTSKTAESFSVLDVAGINYGDGRYEVDRELNPNRIIVGTETFPSHIDVLWDLVESNSRVIGDFTWSGWDYLGEVGIGRTRYQGEPPEFEAPFPWRTAWCGDLDITGRRRTISYYRETIFGLRSAPYIAVIRPKLHGKTAITGGWAWSDSVSSWTWSAEAGAPVTVEVYSDADEVELQLNGECIARTPTGLAKKFLATFDVTYKPGELVAVAIRNGEPAESTRLVTARGQVLLKVECDRHEISNDTSALGFVTIEFRDENGVLFTDSDRQVSVTVSGPGVLVGLGTGQPDSAEPFDGTTCTTFDGTALAIVRPTGTGTITVEVTADGLATSRTTIAVTGDTEQLSADFDDMTKLEEELQP
ncbi:MULTISPECIES: glycoside hydrolase family 2 TIM barrel-domain containing protein [unclassified Frondihabitans]|uniref:glycoside hydrolase family 2 TIM barrel-domain containing protein n=1 Tax=unclassified Frondihabitans TaxID=2626248 RepID=UPI000F4E74F9|nr:MULTISPECIES: glycoside hydrolase family 2 TIM barrel-domain containing protein [unclassified Frondihabitans]RPE77805.1 beta-galactosidase [Frondihabitans sp. PhB153]RPF08084.1 beta-galactosidase [Frondihabitans sp. PhB161]